MPVVVSGDARRNGWQLAETAAGATSHGRLRLVATAACDLEGVRDDPRACVVDALGITDGVLMV